jgi:hypothetical protein
MGDSIRRIKNKTESFTIILNEVFKRPDLSARAKGLYAYIMTLPDDWILHKEELYTHFTEGRDALDKAFGELCTTGYIVKNLERDDKGKIISNTFVIYESSIHNTEKPETGEMGDREKTAYSLKNRKTENQSLENRNTENPQLLKTNITKDLEQKNSQTKSENPPEQPEPTKNQSLSTADAVVVENPDDVADVSLPETALIPVKKPDKTSITFSPVDSPPKKRKTKELTPEQKLLYQAAVECFESSEKAKAIIYQDKSSTQMQMECLKNIVVRCCGMAPGITVDFLKSILEHFRVMTNSQKHDWVFTPRCLSAHWIWEIVINSLPERETEMDKNIRESIKGLFKKG